MARNMCGECVRARRARKTCPMLNIPNDKRHIGMMSGVSTNYVGLNWDPVGYDLVQLLISYREVVTYSVGG